MDPAGFHDAFGLYGRPKNYSWDKGDPASLFFGYQDRGLNVRPANRKDPSNADMVIALAAIPGDCTGCNDRP